VSKLTTERGRVARTIVTLHQQTGTIASAVHTGLLQTKLHGNPSWAMEHHMPWDLPASVTCQLHW